MADKKISDLTAIATQASTDLYETSANGTGSFKETRAQQLAYVSGQQFAKNGCVVATTATLNATYANGSSGVGATLTNAGALIALVIDGVSLGLGDRVLVKDQSSQLQNGIYTCTETGFGGVNPWVLTRATDFDTSAEITVGDYTVIAKGNVNAGRVYAQNQYAPLTIGTDSIIFVTNTFTPAYTAYASTNGNNSTGDGSPNNPYADPFAASNALTGSVANPNLVIYTSGKYSTTSFSIKPNVSLEGDLNSVLTVTNPITLDSSWTSAAAGTKSYLTGINSTNGMSLDWSTASLGGVTVLEMTNCVFGSGNTFTATTGHKPTILIENSQLTAPTFQSIIATVRNIWALSTFTVQPSAGGGSTNLTLVNSYLPVAMTITGASGSASTVTIQACTNISSLTVDTTFVTLTIDAASYPVGGITYTNGATSAQVTVQRGDLPSSSPVTIINSGFYQTDGSGKLALQNASTTRTNLSVPGLATNNAFTAQNGITPVAITSSSGSTAWNLNTAPNATYAATENSNLAAATNQVAGTYYPLVFVQNGSAAKTFTFDSSYKFPGGVVPIVSTGLNAVDMFMFRSNGSTMYCVGISQNIS